MSLEKQPMKSDSVFQEPPVIPVKPIPLVIPKEDEKIEYLKKYIQDINAPKFKFEESVNGKDLFGSPTNLKTFLKARFVSEISDHETKQKLMKELKAKDFKRNSIPEIANKYLFYKKDLEEFFNLEIQQKVISDLDKRKYIKNILDYIKDNTDSSEEFKFVQNSLKKIIHKQLDFVGTNGFATNLLNINTGIMTANAGDSAQFLFLARAILAGFNCSNVDVRSSRYDAVIDFEGKLLRVQVKGVSGASISFRDRDRGGQGIDHTHERNRGKRITSEDCDIYVAVDKGVGTCYIIPMKNVIDPLSDEDIKSVSLTRVEDYKENWNVISEVAEQL